MFKFSRKIEYGILALQYMAGRKQELVSAKEIAENLELSFDFLAKTLQTLMKRGLVASHQGIHGGYLLAKDADKISISEIIRSLEKNISIVECSPSIDEASCSRMKNCTIRGPLLKIEKKMLLYLEQTSIAEISQHDKKTKLEIKIRN
ncbi:MAG: Rrf2 family transcriptional regulator [Candidatus Kapabacteria bacterium]|nr:Rrf2 family transcriptional regulator [Candidatus Kapabacteria bacterium]